ncbi:MAG: hypothetical protein C0407_00990 [Desulfobacca sp.]|nr:hypothetical protein [Desulfobacca sp.]
MTDRHFLEFWGNLLLQTAQGQKQLEDFSLWFNQGLKGFNELTALFGKFYGLEPLADEAPTPLSSWEKASEEFQKAFKDYMTLFGFVPKQEHDRLLQELEVLKDKTRQQEDHTKQLQTLLITQAIDPTDMARGFQDLVKKQSDQFQDLLKGFGGSGKKTTQKEKK